MNKYYVIRIDGNENYEYAKVTVALLNYNILVRTTEDNHTVFHVLCEEYIKSVKDKYSQNKIKLLSLIDDNRVDVIYAMNRLVNGDCGDVVDVYQVVDYEDDEMIFVEGLTVSFD